MQIQESSTNANASTRLAGQLAFIAELDKLKDILRRSIVGGSGRSENSAEHSWHLTLMAIVLLEYSSEPDVDEVIRQQIDDLEE